MVRWRKDRDLEMTRKPGDKFDWIRMTSLSCVSEPQAAALLLLQVVLQLLLLVLLLAFLLSCSYPCSYYCLQAGDLRAFTDLINCGDVEQGAGEEGHWVNLTVVDTGAR